MVAGSASGCACNRSGECDADPFLLGRYLGSRAGDVKKLKSPLSGFRLRCGDFRVFFDHKDENAIEITGIRHRREAY